MSAEDDIPQLVNAEVPTAEESDEVSGRGFHACAAEIGGRIEEIQRLMGTMLYYFTVQRCHWYRVSTATMLPCYLPC